MPDLLHSTVADFLAATAAKQPTPGGGSVAALCGALAASLAQMALQYTTGKKAFAQHEVAIQSALGRFAAAADLFKELIAEDIAAYETLSPFLKLSPEQRALNTNYLPAVVAAILAPETTANLAYSTLETCSTLLDKTSKHLLSDLGIAAVYAHATVHASQLNVLVNLPLLPNPGEGAEIRTALEHLSQKADKTYQLIREHMLKTL